jgi:thiamine-monophosphate kinase
MGPAATVREAGEFGLIARLLDALPERARAGGGLSVAAGDDAAVQAVAPGESIVVSTDTLVEGIHFRLDWTDWPSLGHKSLAVNLSDLAAMAARPLLATVSLGLRGDERVDDLAAMYGGMGELAVRSGIRVRGRRCRPVAGRPDDRRDGGRGDARRAVALPRRRPAG